LRGRARHAELHRAAKRTRASRKCAVCRQVADWKAAGRGLCSWPQEGLCDDSTVHYGGLVRKESRSELNATRRLEVMAQRACGDGILEIAVVPPPLASQWWSAAVCRNFALAGGYHRELSMTHRAFPCSALHPRDRRAYFGDSVWPCTQGKVLFRRGARSCGLCSPSVLADVERGLIFARQLTETLHLTASFRPRD